MINGIVFSDAVSLPPPPHAVLPAKLNGIQREIQRCIAGKTTMCIIRPYANRTMDRDLAAAATAVTDYAHIETLEFQV